MEYKQLDEIIKTFNEDLLKTRIDLQKLKQSIQRSIKQIKQNLPYRSSVDKLLKKKEFTPMFKKNQSQNQQFSVLKSMYENFPVNLCEKCRKEISYRQNKENIKYSQCQLCRQTYFESKDHHDQYLCGQAKMCCQSCGLQMERKHIDKHVKICQFRNCFKCDKKIYLKAFAFHLKVCKKQNKRLFSSKKQSQKENIPFFQQKVPFLH